MTFSRAGRLRPLAACLLCSLPLFSQQPTTPQPAQPQSTQQPPATTPQQKKNNPFEAVPQSSEPPAQPPRLEAPKPAIQTVNPNAAPPENVIEDIQFRGARRVPQDTLRALIFTKKGDVYDEDTLHRDFMTLWNTGR